MLLRERRMPLVARPGFGELGQDEALVASFWASPSRPIAAMLIGAPPTKVRAPWMCWPEVGDIKRFREGDRNRITTVSAEITDGH